jgi:hypothetical protein
MASAGRFTDSGNYHAYLVRLWRADASQPWEMVAKDVETGEEYPFADPDALFDFLTDRLPVFRRRTHRSDHEKENH